MRLALWLGALAAAGVFALSVGGAPLDWAQVGKGIFSARNEQAAVFLELRLPRVALAALIGALLSTSGCVLQGVLRNPLADPYLLGVSSGAALGALLGISLGLAFPAPLAIAGGALALALVLGVARRKGFADPARLVLAGAAVHSVASSLMTLLLFRLSGRPESSGLYFWLLGGLTALPWDVLGWLAALSALTLAGLLCLAPSLNLLSLGRESAQSLGLSADRTAWIALLLAAAAAGLAVTFNGMIPFLGLLVPHGARAVAGRDYRRALPASMILGAGLAMVADALGRWCWAPREVPTGVVTALAGAPLFLFLLIRREKS